MSIATFQSRTADEFDGLYAPIIGSSENTPQHVPVETDPALLARTNRFRREYDELRGDMIQELNAADARMIQPAAAAKDYLAPMKKTIKKRNDKKVNDEETLDPKLQACLELISDGRQTDFERYQSRVDSLIHKPKRSDRENANLAKAEADLANAKQVRFIRFHVRE